MSAAPRRLVVKFGGSVLPSGAAVAEAARLFMEAPVEERLAVVSAPEGMTDRLVRFVDEVPHPIDPSDEAKLVAYGERISARLFTAILRSRGVSVRLLEPEDPDWPILTRGGSVGAEIDPAPSRERAVAVLRPLLRTQAVVICGFLGRQGRRHHAHSVKHGIHQHVPLIEQHAVIQKSCLPANGLLSHLVGIVISEGAVSAAGIFKHGGSDRQIAAVVASVGRLLQTHEAVLLQDWRIRRISGGGIVTSGNSAFHLPTGKLGGKDWGRRNRGRRDRGWRDYRRRSRLGREGGAKKSARYKEDEDNGELSREFHSEKRNTVPIGLDYRQAKKVSTRGLPQPFPSTPLPL